MARTLQQHSRHAIDILTLARDHWRTIALSGHRAIVSAMESIAGKPYDLIIFSGPADVRLVCNRLPPALGNPAVASYFHESQWTYPADSLDRIPHLVSHLEAVEASDVVWFNSRFHRRTFYESAWDHPSAPVRALAREILPGSWSKTAVLYPPVEVADMLSRRDKKLRVAWSARWEQEKRPDLLLAIARQLVDRGIDIGLHILGCDEDRWREEVNADPKLGAIVERRSGYLPQDDYWDVLASSDIWLSTAEHEFFGIAAIEAAMLGATPVVPAALAYGETLPSAVTYPPGDIEAAADRVIAIRESHRQSPGPWLLDALRYRTSIQIAHVDTAIDAVNRANRIGAQP